MDSFGESAGRTLREQGVDALSRGERDRARELFEAATRQEPGDEQVWLWLSRVARNDVERRAALEQGLALHPHSTPLLQARAELGVAPGSSDTTAAGGFSSAGLQTQALPRQYAAPEGSGAYGQQPSPPPYAGPQPGQPGYNPYAPGASSYAPQAQQPGQYAVPPIYAYPGMGQQSGYFPGMPRRRPGCITAFAIVALLLSLLLLCAFGGIAAVWDDAMREIQNNPNSNFDAQTEAQMTVLADVMKPLSWILAIWGLVGVTMSIGLLRGSRWGWWLATISLASSILSSIFTSGLTLVSGDPTALPGAVLQIAIAGGLLAYFYSNEPIQYFELVDRPKPQLMAISFGCGLILAAAVSVWSWSITRDLQQLQP